MTKRSGENFKSNFSRDEILELIVEETSRDDEDSGFYGLDYYDNRLDNDKSGIGYYQGRYGKYPKD